MATHQSNSACLSHSYNHSEQFGKRATQLRGAKLSESEHNQWDYNTFGKLSNDPEEIRTRSVSLPYVPYGPRTVKRSFSRLETTHHDEDTTRLIDGSTHDLCDHDSDSSDESLPIEGKNADKKYFGYTKRQFKVGVALCIISIIDTMGFGVFSPFFPIVAEEKNLSEIEIGFIFASFSMAGIFGSLFTGTLLVQVGAKFIILSGFFWCAGSTICFGLLDQVSKEYFFWLCCACRVFMGIGSAAAFTALFAVIFQEFGDRSLTVIGVSESLCTIGSITGPLIGAGLYSIGGFFLPFAVVGGFDMIAFFAAAFLIPHVTVQRDLNAVSPARLLLNLHALLSSLVIILSFIVISFMTANVSVFLTNSFHLPTVMVGVYMLISSLCYGISTPIFGRISDKRDIGAHLMVLCCFITGIAMSLFGPADFWMNWFGWTEPHKWLVIFIFAIYGCTLGGMIMPTFGEMLIAAKQLQLHENELAQYGLVSGLWNTVFSVGDILGPTIGGAISAKCGFNNTLAIFGAMLIVVAVLKTIHLVYLHYNQNEITQRGTSSDLDEGDDTTNLLGADHSAIQT